MRIRPRAGTLVAAAMIALSAAASSGCGSGAPAVADGGREPTNLEVARALVAAMGGGIIDSLSSSLGDTVALDVDSSTSSWIARTELAGLLGRTGRRVVDGGARAEASTRWTVRGLALDVAYRDIRRPGFFSGALLDREVSAGFTSELSSAGVVLYAGALSRSAIDTIAEERIPDLESGSPDDMRGAVPAMQTLDRFVEPLVIIGAAAAAIFLFFQVRS